MIKGVFSLVYLVNLAYLAILVKKKPPLGFQTKARRIY
jgi:hypothetical protein